MAVSFTLTSSSPLPGGQRIVYGTVTMNSYRTNGEATDLSTYFSGSPFVKVESTTVNYTLHHNGGTAAAGKIVASVGADVNAASGQALAEVANATDVSSVTGNLMAIGVAV